MVKNINYSTPEEKQWLLACIKQDKFIPKEELDEYDSEGNLIKIDKPFEFNKWYKSGKSYLYFIKSTKSFYGFYENKWINYENNGNLNLDDWISATDSEVKQALLNYAKEKYPVGTTFKSAQTDREYIVKTNSYCVYNSLDAVEVDRVSYLFLERKWAEIISEPETKEPKEMQLSDLKNPVFNIGDKVRVIANSLKEFNSSWTNGNNANYKKDYEGLITGIVKAKSDYYEVSTWYYLDDNPISCNLLELVEPAKKEFDRDWYVEVSSQEEADKVFDWLEARGENTFRGYAYFGETSKYIRQWNNTGYKYHSKWFLSSEKNNKPQKQLSDILPEYKQPIRTKEGFLAKAQEQIIKDIWNAPCNFPIQNSITMLKSSDFAEPIIIKSKKQKRNKLIINN